MARKSKIGAVLTALAENNSKMEPCERWIAEINTATGSYELQVKFFQIGMSTYRWSDHSAWEAIDAEKDVYETTRKIIQERFAFTEQQLLFEVLAAIRKDY